MYESVSAMYCCDVPFDYYSNVVKVGGKCRLEIRQDMKNDINDIDIEGLQADRIIFTIAFEDVCQNRYHQEFRFLMGNVRNGEIIEI
ncbi:MAG: hypothetical protein FWC09_10850, partial [Lachnospiraceae bacterium]|nr:hypothetical protein [Lachnospiraceae bacterium]